MPSPMTMKNRMPPSAQNKPKVAATCIQSLRSSGFFITIKPDTANGAPSMLGKYDVMDSDSDTIEITMPHAMRNTP